MDRVDDLKAMLAEDIPYWKELEILKKLYFLQESMFFDAEGEEKVVRAFELIETIEKVYAYYMYFEDDDEDNEPNYVKGEATLDLLDPIRRSIVRNEFTTYVEVKRIFCACIEDIRCREDQMGKSFFYDRAKEALKRMIDCPESEANAERTRLEELNEILFSLEKGVKNYDGMLFPEDTPFKEIVTYCNEKV